MALNFSPLLACSISAMSQVLGLTRLIALKALKNLLIQGDWTFLRIGTLAALTRPGPLIAEVMRYVCDGGDRGYQKDSTSDIKTAYLMTAGSRKGASRILLQLVHS